MKNTSNHTLLLLLARSGHGRQQKLEPAGHSTASFETKSGFLGVYYLLTKQALSLGDKHFITGLAKRMTKMAGGRQNLGIALVQMCLQPVSL
jgi:hypothetical protein